MPQSRDSAIATTHDDVVSLEGWLLPNSGGGGYGTGSTAGSFVPVRLYAVSDDYTFASVLEVALGPRVAVVAASRRDGREAILRGSANAECVVFDARANPGSLIDDYIQLQRFARRTSVKCVFIMSIESVPAPAMIGGGDRRSTVETMFSNEAIPELLRTHLLDPSGTHAALTAHRCLLHSLSTELHELDFPRFGGRVSDRPYAAS